MEYQDYQPAEAYDYGYSDEAAITNQMEGVSHITYHLPFLLDSGAESIARPAFLR